MKTLSAITLQSLVVGGISIIAASPAFAGSTVPGPALGAGAPALAVIAGSYWLLRRYRRR